MEIRVHGRGGQGGVTCAKILAAVYSSLGKSVQSFGDYAGERSGAPIRAYTRVADQPITNRNKVYRPDHLLVLDPTLLGPEVVSGLVAGGTLLLNSPEPPEAFADRFGEFRVATVDATAIARRHGIGTRSVVIVNTTIAGAFLRALELPVQVLEATYDHLGLRSNFAAACEAYRDVKLGTARPSLGAASTALPRVPEIRPLTGDSSPSSVLPLVSHVEAQPTGLKTGSWRTQKPRYAHHLAPCNVWCPAGVDVIGFVQALARKGEDAAAAVLSRTMPLAGVCGRVCPAPCMDGCNRRELDGAVNIRGLERWVADHATIAPRQPEKNPKPRRIAIVGGGPAGLSAAYALARKGHHVAIFDGERALGGALATGIPSFRLPRAVLEREIAAIVALGVEVHTSQRLGAARLGKLAREHEAVIVATGLQKPLVLDLPGSSLEGVEGGTGFLRRTILDPHTRIAGRVVVLGGGNDAIDCARAAIRAGASHVTLAHGRSGSEITAIPEEVDAARDEGVEFLYECQPVAFRGAGRVRGVEFAEVVLGPPDEAGHRAPIATSQRLFLDCDLVLEAIGSTGEDSAAFLPTSWAIREGRVYASDQPLNVFVAGDAADGERTIAHAIGAGRRAAGLALQALGVDSKPFERPRRDDAVPVTDIRLDHFARVSRAHESTTPVAARLRSFDEVSTGLADALEAHRCFSCGTCTRCDTCMVYCPEGIIRRRAQAYTIDYAYCKGCGVCVTECPRNAMEMVPE